MVDLILIQEHPILFLGKYSAKKFAEIDILKIVLELLLFVLSCRDQKADTNNVCCLNTECAQLNRGLVMGNN